MFSRVLPGLLLLPSATTMGAACTTKTVVTPPPETADAAAEEPRVAEIAEAGTEVAACVLTGDMKTGREDCDSCLQAKCCVAITTCLSDKACSDMNTCANECRMDSACVRACAEKDPEAAERLLDAKDCQAARCRSACKA